MYDAVIVGAGILGLATAYHIKELRPNDRILVIDKLKGPGQGNTAKSAAMFRTFFSSRTNLLLAKTSIEFYEYVEKKLGYDLGMRWTGYLFLITEEEYKRNKPVLQTMKNMGLEYKIYDADYLAKTLNINVKVSQDEEAQMMGLVDIDYGLFIPRAGCIDVDSLVKFYEQELRKKNVEIKCGVEAKELIVEPKEPLELPGEPYPWQEASVTGVRTNIGDIKAKKVILATGAWTPLLLDKIGIDCHIKAKKRQIFSIKADKESLKKLLYTKGFNPENCMPFLILPKPKIWIKPALEEKAIWIGLADEFPREFKVEDDPQPEMNFYEYGLYPVIIKYLPQFKDARPYSSWAGLYAINTIDEQPIIFETHGVLVVSGASGSGIMKADAIGRIAAALYAGMEYAELSGGERIKTTTFSIEKRETEPERFVL